FLIFLSSPLMLSLFPYTTLCRSHIIFASLAAYPLAKHDFPGKNLLFQLVVLSLMFSYQVTFIPNYMIISFTGINNTYLAVILPADRKSTRLNSSHVSISYAVFCL